MPPPDGSMTTQVWFLEVKPLVDHISFDGGAFNIIAWHPDVSPWNELYAL